jgi:hypothetical protein
MKQNHRFEARGPIHVWKKAKVWKKASGFAWFFNTLDFWEFWGHK